MTLTLEQQQLLSTWLPVLAIIIVTFLLILIFILLTKQEKRLKLHMFELLNQQVKQSEAQFLQQLSQLQEKQKLQLSNSFEQQMADLRIKLLRQMGDQKDQLKQSQSQSLDQIINHLNNTAKANREELAQSLTQSSEQMTKRIDGLTDSTDKRLQEISGQVEKRLSEGFEKTTKTFSDILQRLALIDDAQKKITELSTNVVSLQEVLNDKRSRGAFGEVQLNSLIRNVLPEQSFKLQHTLSNGKIADCVLFLPKPTGNVVVDSKFPLESYRKMMDFEVAELDRKAAMRQFKVDIKKHINDISDKYLIDNETADGAIMFIPAEAIFAEIHGHQSDLVDYANKQRVWLASPTTLMAILTTARSVLKDEATRQQIHIIQAHLSNLAQDFNRFKGRFANLAKHIDQAATDVKQIHTSADKIANRFEKIEQVELIEEEVADELGLLEK
ncbi:MAG: DNA recombination protein RmuC [Colwellia sp.]|nr:DNA recombination protein RmuC [Colwellia sp.]